MIYRCTVTARKLGAIGVKTEFFTVDVEARTFVDARGAAIAKAYEMRDDIEHVSISDVQSGSNWGQRK